MESAPLGPRDWQHTAGYTDTTQCQDGEEGHHELIPFRSDQQTHLSLISQRLDTAGVMGLENAVAAGQCITEKLSVSSHLSRVIVFDHGSMIGSSSLVDGGEDETVSK